MFAHERVLQEDHPVAIWLNVGAQALARCEVRPVRAHDRIGETMSRRPTPIAPGTEFARPMQTLPGIRRRDTP